MKILLSTLAILVLSGCSVLGKSNVETAPYRVLQAADTQEKIEIRQYDSLVLVSTSMAQTNGSSRNLSFSKLFDYISGNNVDASKIAMTAPVFMDTDNKDAPEGVKIPMTAPVFMDAEGSQPQMSFVLPDNFTIESAPKPLDPDVKLHEVKDYTVAAIIFSGRLSDSNISKHRQILEQWVTDNGFNVTGPYKMAGYNAPFTLPAMRRNEVLIPIEKP